MIRVKTSPIIGEVFLDFIFPCICSLCHEYGKSVCQDCSKKLVSAEKRCIVCSRKNPLGKTCLACFKAHEPDSALAAFKYQETAQELVKLYKYYDVSSLKYFFADSLASVIKNIESYKEYDLAYIPLTSRKKCYRGYNQSELVAQCISKKLNLRLTDLLTRVDVPHSQVLSESKKERLANIKGAFSAKSECPELVILLDDVITSGATMREATKVLKKNGTKKVVCVSIAM